VISRGVISTNAHYSNDLIFYAENVKKFDDIRIFTLGDHSTSVAGKKMSLRLSEIFNSFSCRELISCRFIKHHIDYFPSINRLFSSSRTDAYRWTHSLLAWSVTADCKHLYISNLNKNEDATFNRK